MSGRLSGAALDETISRITTASPPGLVGVEIVFVSRTSGWSWVHEKQLVGQAKLSNKNSRLDSLRSGACATNHESADLHTASWSDPEWMQGVTHFGWVCSTRHAQKRIIPPRSTFILHQHCPCQRCFLDFHLFGKLNPNTHEPTNACMEGLQILTRGGCCKTRCSFCLFRSHNF